MSKSRRLKWHDGPGGYGRCRSCGDPIRWLITANGRMMPTNADRIGPDETHFDHKRHVSHFASCRQADMWRPRKAAPGRPPPEGGP